LSEQLLQTLQMLASSTHNSSSGSSSLSKSPSRRRSGSGSRAADGAAALLKQLHPLFFAQPLAAFGSKGTAALPGVLQEERAQQQQMGVAVAVGADAWQVAMHVVPMLSVQVKSQGLQDNVLCEDPK
jgi:hypothetical protein